MKKLNVVLINLISPEYLVRYQAPLAVNVLKNHLAISNKDVDVKVIDMQGIFYEQNKIDNQEQAFLKTINKAVDQVKKIIDKGPAIVGLSIKWNTQKVAEQIITSIRNRTGKTNCLFVVGNIGSTFGYKGLLKKEVFQEVLAVVGEGEDALGTIVTQASKNQEDIANLNNYLGIPNVAMNLDGELKLDSLKRVELEKYPNALLEPEQIYDQEWKVHALETSRGCPWGKCTFCSIGCQFGKTLNNCKGDTRWSPYPLDLVFRNIKNLVAKGVRVIDFKDSEFFGPVRKTADNKQFNQTMDRVEEFAKGMIEINNELKKENPDDQVVINHISVRADTIYKEGEEENNKRRLAVYKLLKKAGLKGIYLGIESGSKGQLKRYAKGTTPEENKEAIKIVRELGLEVEVGFIFFDFLATLDDLKENIDFIEETKLFETDSRLYGSLRVQNGSTYALLAKNQGLLGAEHEDSLSFDCEYKHEIVSQIEQIYALWEESTRKLARLINEQERLEYYALNHYFLKSIIYAIHNKCEQNVVAVVKQFAEIRSNLLAQTRDSITNNNSVCADAKFKNEYLTFAINSNTTLLSRIEAKGLLSTKIEILENKGIEIEQ